jgi:hypothetical protein
MGALGVKAAVAACGGSAGIACGPAVALGIWGINEATEGLTWFRSENAEGINPVKEGLKATSIVFTNSPMAGEGLYNSASLVMNGWSAKTATQLWLTTPKLGGGWLATGYAWQSMGSAERSWLLFDSARTVIDATAAKR